MHYGFCTGFAADPLFSIDETHEALASSLGFTYIEYPLMTVTALNDDAFLALLERRDAAGLTSPAVCNLFPGSVRVIGEERDEGKIRAYLDKAFARAAALGAYKLIFGSAGARRLGAYPRDKADAEFMETLLLLNGYAVEHDSSVLIEAIHAPEADYITTLSEAAPFVLRAREKGLDRIALMADLCHMELSGEPLSVLETCFPYLQHVHVAAPDRSPAVTDYAASALSLLASLGYNGDVSFESSRLAAGWHLPIG